MSTTTEEPKPLPLEDQQPTMPSLEGEPSAKVDNYSSLDSSRASTDDEEEDDYDDGSVISYKIEVQEAIKMETHTGYKMLIIPSRGKPYTVVHRYSDFHTLQERLMASYPFVTSFAFPSKKIFNKEKEFIEKRKVELQTWITKVVDNVNLINSRDVRAFLEIKERGIGKPTKSNAYKDPTLVIDVESTKQVDDADKAIREKLKEWRDQLRESKETATLRENLEEQLIEEAKALACRQKIEALKRGAVLFELVSKGKPTRMALRLNNAESELRFGPVVGDTMPECESLPSSMSLVDVDRVIVGTEVPMIQKNKKQNSAVSFALVSNLPEPPVHALTNGVAALSAAEYTDCVDGIRALLGKSFVMRSTVEGISALVYVDINLRLMELTEQEVASNLQTVQVLPPVPNDFEYPE